MEGCPHIRGGLDKGFHCILPGGVKFLTMVAMILLSLSAATMPMNPTMTTPTPVATRNTDPYNLSPSENVANSFQLV